MIFPSSSSAAAVLFRSSPVTKRHGESRILQTHPLHLFRIIQDVDKYQDFLPLCKLSQVFPDTIRDNGRTFDAKLMVGKPPLFSEEYVSRVTVIPEQLRVETRSISSSQSMFDSLTSSWRLQRVDAGYYDESMKESRDGTTGNRENPSSSQQTQQQQLYKNIRCHVDFEVEMTVSNPAVIAVLDKVLMHVAGHQVEAFDQRCHELPRPMDLIERVEQQNHQ